MKYIVEHMAAPYRTEWARLAVYADRFEAASEVQWQIAQADPDSSSPPAYRVRAVFDE